MRNSALIGLLLVAPLAACERPSEACTADETLTTAKSLLLDYLISNPLIFYPKSDVDIDLAGRALDDVVTVDLIRFEGEDKASGTITCRARVTSPSSSGQNEMTYTRERDLGTKGFVYSIQPWPARTGDWYELSSDIAARYTELERGSMDASAGPASSPPSAPSSTGLQSNDPVPADVLAQTSPPPPAAPPPAIPTSAEERAETQDSPVVAPPPPQVTPQRPVDRIASTVPPAYPPRQTQPPVRREPVTNPQWTVAPRPEFPQRAQALGLETGFVQVECVVNANGSLSSCEVLSETPSGAGFAQAALRASARARLSPRTVDSAIAGDRVRFSVPFRQE